MTEAMPFLQKRYYFLTTPDHSGRFLFLTSQPRIFSTASLIGEPLRKEIFQHKNRQRRGKEEKAALPVYENS